MNRRQLPLLLGGLALAALLLAVVAIRIHSEVPVEDRRAEELLSAMNRGAFLAPRPEEMAKAGSVPVAAMVRVMVRPDSPLTKMYRQLWDVLPSWLKHRCPRPLDERTRGLLVRANLMRRQDTAGAMPVLAAVLTNPRAANRQGALILFRDLGAWVPDEIVEPALKGLQDTNAVVQLRVLESLRKIWPDQPDLQRRIAELQHEVKP